MNSERKCRVGLFVGVAMLLLLSSCGVPKPPNEIKIASDVPEDIRTITIGDPFGATNPEAFLMDVKSVAIEKRKTNKKDDAAYCVVELENEYYAFTKSVGITFWVQIKGNRSKGR